MNRIRIGIFFGGKSREREVSFAGGRTVYDNLNKQLFEAVPIFVDSFNQFIILDWNFIYKGTIRDFYPPPSFVPKNQRAFQLYAENLDLSAQEPIQLAQEIGKPIYPHEFKDYFDCAFLALHGSFGEDGTLQGLLEWYQIPYTGSGILGSAIGINKRIQKQLNPKPKGYAVTPYIAITEASWDQSPEYQQQLFTRAHSELGFPLVVKSATQGSSIGIQFVKEPSFEDFTMQVEACFFRTQIDLQTWRQNSNEENMAWVKNLTDIRSGIGLPVISNKREIHNPQILYEFINEQALNTPNQLLALRALDRETELVLEPMIQGREFSCIVLKTPQNQIQALPPTEIIKRNPFFDYRSKYLPGLSRKVTPMDVDHKQLKQIGDACCELMQYFDFKVYARIDGFLTPNGTLYLNDPNTTSGMMPSSFFFHQAAEIGLSPSEFITYIIYASLQERVRTTANASKSQQLLQKLNLQLSHLKASQLKRERIGVILGGNSFERHISVESGRNIYEKLNSSGKYEVVPLFLDYTHEQMRFFKLPINMLLKDNADDIREKLLNYRPHAYLQDLRTSFQTLTQTMGVDNAWVYPQEIAAHELKQYIDGAFIALHGRPGEDGTIQKVLQDNGLYYNGSGIASSAITIDKYKTLQTLKEHGFPVATQQMVYKEAWLKDPNTIVNQLEQHMGFPLICKPHDDGCSAAVHKIKNAQAFRDYAELMFRSEPVPSPERMHKLGLRPEDEFPAKDSFLVETFINAQNAEHFLEITGGLLTQMDSNGQTIYQVFEPSEALAEGEVLSLEEKFLAGQGQNITPARYHSDPQMQASISRQVKQELQKVAQILKIEGYCRIDAFVRIFPGPKAEVIVIEVNSLPGMTPATCIYHQAALQNLKPFEFIEQILEYGKKRLTIQTTLES